MNKSMIEELNRLRLINYTPDPEYKKLSMIYFKKLRRYLEYDVLRWGEPDGGHEWDVIVISGRASELAKKQLGRN